MKTLNVLCLTTITVLALAACGEKDHSGRTPDNGPGKEGPTTLLGQPDPDNAISPPRQGDSRPDPGNPNQISSGGEGVQSPAPRTDSK
jgi:hypothetical protein